MHHRRRKKEKNGDWGNRAVRKAPKTRICFLEKRDDRMKLIVQGAAELPSWRGKRPGFKRIAGEADPGVSQRNG